MRLLPNLNQSTMHWYTAPLIHDGQHFLNTPSYICMDEAGFILDITSTRPLNAEVHAYEGILCPGFVNVHVHLELSHMKGRIEKHTGLPGFLTRVMTNRTSTEASEIYNAISSTIAAAHQKGIVAFGDICNTTHTIPAKQDSDLHFHSFIEALGKLPARAASSMSYVTDIYSAFESAASLAPQRLNQSIVPHAPYSISDALMTLINEHDPNATISIHNQESAAEDELFLYGEGPFKEFLLGIHIPSENIISYQSDAVTWLSKHIQPSHPFILVHNTFIGAAQVQLLKNRYPSLHFCLCPNANMYIENTMPPIDLLMENNVNICLGTDSIASNDDIDIMKEMLTIKQHFPTLSWEVLLRWATYQGAVALGKSNVIGSLQKGTKPGLVHIDEAFETSALIAY